MTKCEEAQKGIDKILDKLEELSNNAFENYGENFDFASEK